MPRQQHHYRVVAVFYRNAKVKARVEREGLPLDGTQVYRGKECYHGFSEPRARTAFYRAARTVQHHPLALHVNVWRDGELFLRVKPAALD